MKLYSMTQAVSLAFMLAMAVALPSQRAKAQPTPTQPAQVQPSQAQPQPAKPPAKSSAKSKAEKKSPAAKDDPGEADVAQPTALDNLKDMPPAPQLACAGPFAKDTTHAKLVTDFGAKNVVFKDVEDKAGVLTKATVVFDADPTRRVVVSWDDVKGRTKPATILIEAPSIWQGPGGIRNGLPLKEMEKLNGGAFSMKGFGGSGGGSVFNLKGPLAAIDGGCSLNVVFEPGIANPLPPRYAAITGDHAVLSTNFLLRRVRAQVSEWSVSYK